MTMEGPDTTLSGNSTKANDCFVAKAEVAIPHQPGPGSVAAFDRTVQIASDEFSVIKQLSYDIRIFESAEDGLQALTDS